MKPHSTSFLAAALIVLGGCGEPGGSGAGGSGDVTGVVLAAPACPVERVDKPCPPQPVSGALVEALDGDDVRGSALTDDEGAFRLELPRGLYVITATNTGGLPTTASEQVTVSDAPVEIELVVDSGIR